MPFVLRPDGSAPLPTFVIGGTQRSGTTALWHWLRAHPEVFMAAGKELHFFDAYWDDGVEAYEKNFADWAGETAIGEVTPNYVFHPDAMKRMVTILPDVRVVMSVRDPVDRAYSQYWARRSRGFEDREFAEVVATEPEEMVVGSGAGYLVARGRYMSQIERILELLPREQLNVVLFDDVELRPVETFGHICRFIGVDDEIVPAEVGQTANQYREFRTQRLRRLARRVPAPLARLVGRINSRPIPYPPLDRAVRAQLVETYRPDTEALAAWLDRDLSAWLS
jgi:hypothetical protein